MGQPLHEGLCKDMDEINNISSNEELEYDDVYLSEENNHIETIETVEVIDISDIETYTVESDVAFPALGESNENLKHQLLNGRELSDQHPITSITGLRDELDNIEALQTLYSNEKQCADYYQWNDENIFMENRIGYFVTLCEDTKTIKISSDDNVFGVTVDNAAFIGGQDNIVRDYKYGLVVYSGVAYVRCESDVNVGDYVVSNNYGVAQKSNNQSGCKVIALHNIDGIVYAMILFDVSMNQLYALNNNLEFLDVRVSDTEKNMATALTAVNLNSKDLDDLKNSIADFQSNTTSKIDYASEGVKNLTGRMDIYQQQIADAERISKEAEAISNSAIVTADSIRREAVDTANTALRNASEIRDQMTGLANEMQPLSDWTSKDGTAMGVAGFVARANADSATLATLAEWKDDGDNTQTLAGTIAKVSEHEALLDHLTSSKGLNSSTIALIEQKADDNGASINSITASVDKYSVGEYSQSYNLTKEEAQNILTPDIVYIPINSHSETFRNSKDTIEFTTGNHYIWDGNNWIEYSHYVVFSETPPSNSGGTYLYWYLNSNNPPSDYEAYALYMWVDSNWKKVNILAGNINNRSVSVIKQETEKIILEITNARGSMASISERLSDTDAQINSITTWQGETGETIAGISQKVNDAEANIALVVAKKNGKSVVNSASIVTAINESGDSSIVLNADHINLNGAITANKTFAIDKSGYMVAIGGTIGNWNITSNMLYSDVNIPYDNDIGYLGYSCGMANTNSTSLNSVVFWAGYWGVGATPWEGVEKQGSDYNWAARTPFYVTRGGNLYATGATISGTITATSGAIGGWTIASDYLETRKESGSNNNRFYISSYNNSAGNWIAAYDSSGTQTFRVTKEGVLSATGAIISGTITATDGTIGGWTINGNKLIATDSNNKVTAVQAGGTYAFAAGGTNHSNYSDCPFRVTHSGTMYATNAIITGSINVNSVIGNPDVGGGSFKIYSDKDASLTNIYNQNIYRVGFKTTELNYNNKLQHTDMDMCPLSIALRHKYDGNYDTSLVIGSVGYLEGTWEWTGSSAALTSDQNLKHDIETLSDEYSVFFDNLIPKRFKYNNGTSDRYHTGFIAQEVYEALSYAGLDSQDVGAYVHFNKNDNTKEHLALRYEEFIALNTSQIQKMKKRVTELENKIMELEGLIKEN